MIITISGDQGSGKTVIAKKIAKKLGYDHLSVGDLQGELAIEKGLTITEMMTLEKKEPWIHKAIDKKTEDIGNTKDNFVIDGWLAYHFIPHSFKIFLEVDEKIGAERIFNDLRPDEPKEETIEKTIKILRHRKKEAHAGFQKHMDLTFRQNNYDYI